MDILKELAKEQATWGYERLDAFDILEALVQDGRIHLRDLQDARTLLDLMASRVRG